MMTSCFGLSLALKLVLNQRLIGTQNSEIKVCLRSSLLWKIMCVCVCVCVCVAGCKVLLWVTRAALTTVLCADLELDLHWSPNANQESSIALGVRSACLPFRLMFLTVCLVNSIFSSQSLQWFSLRRVVCWSGREGSGEMFRGGGTILIY